MKRIILLLIVCFFATVTNAALDKDFYSDDVIQNGDVYGTVNIYDTPPDQTHVEMLGGDISYCNINDTAIFNMYGGGVPFLYSYGNAIAKVFKNEELSSMQLHGNSELHIYGGGTGGVISVQIYDNAKMHVYGINLEYNGNVMGLNTITGFWENGEAFTLGLRNNDFDPLSQVLLYEIPEPATFLLFSIGSILLKRNCN